MSVAQLDVIPPENEEEKAYLRRRDEEPEAERADASVHYFDGGVKHGAED